MIFKQVQCTLTSLASLTSLLNETFSEISKHRASSVDSKKNYDTFGISTLLTNLDHFLAFSGDFVLLKLTCLVSLCDSKLQVFKNPLKWTIFGILNKLLSTQNKSAARFVRNVK